MPGRRVSTLRLFCVRSPSVSEGTISSGVCSLTPRLIVRAYGSDDALRFVIDRAVAHARATDSGLFNSRVRIYYLRLCLSL